MIVKTQIVYDTKTAEMNYEETIEYLYAHLPTFHRDGQIAFKAGLQNITALCEALGNPQNKFKSIHHIFIYIINDYLSFEN